MNEKKTPADKQRSTDKQWHVDRARELNEDRHTALNSLVRTSTNEQHLRIGQLLVNALEHAGLNVDSGTLFNLPDKKLVEVLEQWRK